MEPVERAKLVLVAEAEYRAALYSLLVQHVPDDDERALIADAVLATMLRKVYLERGQPWLEGVLRMVLQPPDQIQAGSGTARSPET